MAVTTDSVYQWQNDVAATVHVGFLKTRRQLSSSHLVVFAAAQWGATRETRRRESENFMMGGGLIKVPVYMRGMLRVWARQISAPSRQKMGPDGVLIFV